jgi:putative oxidoreductase
MNGGGTTKLLFPGLSGFYATVEPIAYALLRFAIGATIFVHGWGKVTGPGAAGVGRYFASLGLPAPTLLAYGAMFFETVGAACIAIGLLTRFFAAALAIEMLIAMLAAHWAHGFLVLVSQQKNGIEFVLLLDLVFLYIAFRGGGTYSVDAKLSKEL